MSSARRVAKKTEAEAAQPPEVPFLEYGGSPAAAPCFRSLFWFAGSLTEPGLQDVLRNVTSWFFEREGARLGHVVLQTNPYRFRGSLEQKRAKLDQWLKKPPAGFTWLLLRPDEVDCVPCLHVRCSNTVVGIEVCLPFDATDLVSAADELATLCTQVGVLCGVQGMGFWLLPRYQNCVAMLPEAGAAYRCAITLRLEDAHESVRREGSIAFGFVPPELEPGIADVGWRTVVGLPFLSRLRVSTTLPGVEQSRTPVAATFTAGPVPLWGERTKGEDLSAYAAVGSALEPVLAPLDVASRNCFVGDPDDEAFMHALRAYRHRYG
jgi:hypothetical protein